MLSGVEFFVFRFGEEEEEREEEVEDFGTTASEAVEDFGTTASVAVVEGEVEDSSLVRVRKKRPRYNFNVLGMPDQEFIDNFGMDRNCFMQLLDEVAPWMKKALKTTLVPPIVKLGLFLRFLVVGSYQKAVTNEYLPPMSQAFISRNISECLNIFEQHLCPKWIQFDLSEEDEVAVKEKFFSNLGLTGIIGCVGGTHIKLKPPGDIRHLYFNTNGYYSINAMMICDYDGVIRYVDARAPGANNNAEVWKASLADEYLMSAYNSGKRNTWVLGDSGYPLLPYLMTPYRQPEHPHEVAYNTKLLKARNIISHCFGVLKNRFRCIFGDKELYYAPATATKIINTCCALHNFCIFNKNSWEITDVVEAPETTCFIENEMPTIEAVDIRDELSQSINE